MEIDSLIRTACATGADLDEPTQQQLLTLALAAGASPKALAERDDAAPQVLARIVATLGARDTDDPATRSALLHSACPLDTVAAFAALPGTPPSWLSRRDVLPDGLADILVATTDGERTLAAMLTRPWLTPDHARTVTARLAGLHYDRYDPDNDPVESYTLEGLRAAADRYPRALAQVCLDRVRAGSPVGGTELVLTRAAIDTMDPHERAEVAAVLFVDALEALPAGGSITERLHDRLWRWHSMLLPDGPQRDTVIAAVGRADLSDCGRRGWLQTTFGPDPQTTDWLDGVATFADVASLVTHHRDRLPEDTVLTLLGMDICDTATAVTLACRLHNRRRQSIAALLAARAHDCEFVTAVVERTPDALCDGAEVLGITPGQLAVRALPGLLARRGHGHRLAIDAARREWGTYLADHVHQLDAACLTAMLGADDRIDVAAVAALAQLGGDELTAAAAVTVADGWTGSLAGLADAVTALRPTG